MISIYHDDDMHYAYKQYRGIVNVYILVALIYAIVCITCLVLYVSLPYNSPYHTFYKVVISICSALFIIFSYPYIGITMFRSRSYFKLLKNISLGLKSKDVAYFSYIDDWSTKDNVDLNVLVFKKWNVKKRKWEENNVYVDAEKELPIFEENEEVALILHGNVLVQYERTGNFLG